MLYNIKKLPFSLIEQISSNNFLVWLSESNKYIVLDSNILNLIVKKNDFSNSDFLFEIMNVLKVDSVSAEKINNDISDLFIDFNSPKLEIPSVSSHPLINCEIDHYYCFNNVIIKVSFGCLNSKFLIHQKYQHLEVFNENKYNVHYNVFIKDKKAFIFNEKQLVGSWHENEMHEFQGKFSIEFLCSLYKKNEHDWMGVFHASTISKNNQSVMFTGDSGNGKSTLVSILMAKGYNIIADDFTPILRSDLKTYCFPTAISIKEKSFEMIESMHPVITDLKEYYINELKGNVKYLPPITNKIKASCNSVVWVKYGKDLDNNLEKISTENALQKFLPEAWISNQEVNANAFMKWITKTNFYELKYSDNKKLISLVDSLFLD